MTELLTAAQMRAIEKAAIDSGEVTGLELMERAGRGVVEAILEEWPEMALTSHRAVVLCGPGNNGGDGFVVARLLKERGWEVEVFLYGDPEKLPPDAKANCERWRVLGNVEELTEREFRAGQTADIYIDAIFGTGLTRGPAGDLASLLRYLGGSGGDHDHYTPRLVAIDVPSGVCLDSGRMLSGGRPEPFLATVPLVTLTVAFDSPKLGHFVQDGPRCCGKTVVKDIGLQAWRETREHPEFQHRIVRFPGTRLVLDEPIVPDSRPFFFSPAVVSKGKGNGHKYTHGHALVLSGPPGKGGAARLAARGALRIGAGLVTVACPPGALRENAARLDAIMLQALKGENQASALAEFLADGRINTICLGPGLGLDDRAETLLECALQTESPDKVRSRALVLDADALTILSRRPDLFACLHEICVLTPHVGEFKRLFPDIHAKLTAPAIKGPAYSKVDAAREAAARAGCVVLFKGPDTVIADSSGHCSVNSAHYDRAAPWLATAGSGDVLAGFITGLLARGYSPMQAAETAAWLHVECALSFGPGLIAEDLPEELPKVFRALGL